MVCELCDCEPDGAGDGLVGVRPLTLLPGDGVTTGSVLGVPAAGVVFAGAGAGAGVGGGAGTGAGWALGCAA